MFDAFFFVDSQPVYEKLVQEKIYTVFIFDSSELKEHKIIYLSFLLTIQGLLLQEAATNDWTKEYSETIDGNLCVFEQLIFLV